MSSFRKRDSEVEREVSIFLDQIVYKGIGAKINRQSDKNAQLKGIDLYLTFRELENVRVDEKALTHYINKNIPTCAFELSFLSRASVIEGWLTDPSKATEYYMVVWLEASKDWDIKASDITHADLLLLSRERLLNHLRLSGLGRDELQKMASDIRASDKDGPHYKGRYDGFYFFYTKHLEEQPINLVMRRSLLRKLATYKFSGPQ